jgi:hypothetical protein
MDTQKSTERTSLASRVRAGVAFLDWYDADWWTRVHAGTLDVNHPCGCVLAQVSGQNYYTARAALDDQVNPGIDLAALGFDGQVDMDDEDASNCEFEALTRLWSFVIRQRQRWVPAVAPTRYLLVPDEAHHLFALRPGGVVEHFDVCHGVWHPAPAEVLHDIAETFGDMTEVAYSDLPEVAQ